MRFFELNRNYLVTYFRIRFIFVLKGTESTGTIGSLGSQQASPAGQCEYSGINAIKSTVNITCRKIARGVTLFS